MKSPSISIWLMIIASTFFWGSNFNAAHAIAGDVMPLSAAAERFAVALFCFWLMRWIAGRAESQISLRDIALMAVLGLAGVFGFNYAFFTAMQTTSALNAALIMALSPMVSTVFSIWLLQARISRRQYFGIALAFLGVALVITGGRFTDLHIVAGDSWMLMACVLWSFYSVSSKRFASHIPSLQFARWTVSMGAVALILAAFVLEHPFVSLEHAHLATHSILIYMSLFGTVLAYIFWLKGIAFLGPEKSAVAFNLVPVFTLCVSMAMGALPNATQIFGMLLVFAGVLISSLRKSSAS